MNLQEFVEKYKGRKVDFDGMYGAQCVDLARQYFKDVWELPKQPEGVVGAQDFYLKHNKRHLQRQMCDCVTYRKGMIPPEGAVVLFGATLTNQYGHIGICIKADEEKITLFEQDGFKQDGAKISEWAYSRVLGWLLKRDKEGQCAEN